MQYGKSRGTPVVNFLTYEKDFATFELPLSKYANKNFDCGISILTCPGSAPSSSTSSVVEDSDPSDSYQDENAHRAIAESATKFIDDSCDYSDFD